MREMIFRVSRMRFVRFASVGVFNTLADFALLNTLLLLTGAQTSEKMLVILLNLISAGSVSVLSYFLNHRFVFAGETRRAHHHNILIFLVITLSGLFIIQGTIFAFVLDQVGGFALPISNVLEYIGLGFVTRDLVQTNLAKAVATVGTMLWNYHLYKKLIFNKVVYQDHEHKAGE